MKHMLDRTEVVLVLFQHIIELENAELIDAFQRATGKPLQKGKYHGMGCYFSGISLADLIEDQDDLCFWLDHLRGVCQHRLKVSA